MTNRSIEQRLSDLRADAIRGASSLARDAAEILGLAARELPAAHGSALTAALTSLSLRILDAQPSMAPLVTLAREVLGALDPTGALAAVRQRAAAAARDFGDRLAVSRAAAASYAAALIPPDRAVLTLSASSVVQAALIHATRTRSPLEVVCLESRPMHEGRALASALAEAGARVTLAVDAAAESLLGRCGAVLLGADSIGDLGVVNKIGSAALARAAARGGIPTFVVADSSKLLPPDFPQLLEVDRPPAEVWADPGPVRVWNRYFEVVPEDLVTGVVLEDGAFSVAELAARRRGLVVPKVLTGWAAGLE
jgi:translation initiation factor 2B subunit (eIF-2B alpha/beta/delta family)